ncbi:diguanylate cyclase [Peribacillus sp. B-H-3]|uniref:sensor domain-containing diguanylate cyclase n=1 Tax=Peribacillus sp. B-H-3 TaxID=3400420 RepID=UPI003B01D92B
MDVSKGKQLTVWILWLLIIPAGLMMTLHFYPLNLDRGLLDMAFFLILMGILSYIPIIINNIPISAYQGVSLAVFLVFGLSAEIIVTQLAFVFLLLTLRLGKNEIYRFPLNSLIFFFVCLLSGMSYYAIGGSAEFNGMLDASHLWYVIAYQLAYFILNSFLIAFVQVALHKKKFTLFTNDTLWDGVATLMILPIGIILFLVYQQMGMVSILLIGIPIISMSLILRLYYNSKEMNAHLKEASEFGQQLTQSLQKEEVLSLFIDRISAIISAEGAYIFDVFNKEIEIQLLRYAENGKEMDKRMKAMRLDSGVCGTVWKTRKAQFYHSRKEWSHLDTGVFPEHVESILAVPIVRNSLVVGVVVMTSAKKRAYEQYQMMIMDILCSYLGVAIENARHHEKARQQSERCALTNLYNFRYFDAKLQEEFNKLDMNILKSLSVILLDIDRFKSVNDTYGHQSGNEILTQLAERLDHIIGKRGVLARYGGEEFVMLLPNMEKAEAYDFAEFIRLSIANKPFVVHSDLDEHRSKLLVPITASIGVAAAPTDAEDAQALIRHADRAMYTGAKQAGRNKVAQYVG